VTLSTYLLLAFGALLGSTVSGITGVGGGMVYLPILTLGVGVKAAVPYLTMLLLVSNISRAWFARERIDWRVLRSFAIGAVPGAAFGAVFYTWLSAFWIAKALGLYLLAYVVMTFARVSWPQTASLRSIAAVGVPAGIVSAVVGGSGPVVMPWLLRYGLIKESFLGTEAVGAALMHAVKISVWSVARVIGLHDVLLLLPLAGLMVAGSYLGTVLVRHMNIRVFRTVLLLTLGAVAIRFLLY
jgi:uncharacterized membrane protein YfcA